MTINSLHNTYDYDNQEQHHDNPSTSFNCLQPSMQTLIANKHYTPIPFTPMQALCTEYIIWFGSRFMLESSVKTPTPQTMVLNSQNHQATNPPQTQQHVPKNDETNNLFIQHVSIFNKEG